MAHRFELQKTKTVTDVASGSQIVYEYKGPTEDISEFLAGLSGWSRLEQSGEDCGVTEISVTYMTKPGSTRPDLPGDDDYGLVSRRWEMRCDREVIPLGACEEVDRLYVFDKDWPRKIEIAARAWKEAYAQWLKDTVSGSQGQEPILWRYSPITHQALNLPTPFQPVWPAGATTDLKAVASLYLWELSRDENAMCEVPTYALEKVETVTGYSTIVASHHYVNRQLTTATLKRLEPTLPASLMLDFNHVTAAYWLKEPPDISYIQGGQCEIRQAFRGSAVYSVLRYGAPL